MSDFQLQGHQTRTLGEKWAKRIRAHRAYHDDVEKKAWATLSNFYRGHFWDKSSQDQDPLQGMSLRTSINMTYSVLDTAITGLLPPKLEADATPRGIDVTEEQCVAAAALVNHSFVESGVREVGKKAIIDCLITGRAIFHVMYDESSDCAVVTLSDVTTTFFDLAAKVTRDIRYWIRLKLWEPEVVVENVRTNKWSADAAKGLMVGAYPEWADKTGTNRKTKEALDEWVVTWECYDVLAKKMYLMPDRGEEILCSENMEYNPFVLLTFSENGEDCRGLSELNLISPNQQDLNTLLSMVIETVYRSSPAVMFDKGLITEEEAKKLTNAKPGSYVGLDLGTNPTGKSVQEAFYSKPSPTAPPETWSMIEKLTSAIALVSALAPASRGQTNGGRTATEQAMLDANIRSRIGSRQTDMRDAWVSVAYLLHVVNQLYMKAPQLLQVASAPVGFGRVVKGGVLVNARPEDIRKARVRYDMTVYTPADDNPAVRAEAVTRVVPTLLQIPNINMRAVVQYLLDAMGLKNWNVDELLSPPAAPGVMPGQGGAPLPGANSAAEVPPAELELAQRSGAAGAPPPPPMPTPQQAMSQEAVAGRTQVG